MLTFVANARDGTSNQPCNTCCCDRATVRPGETNRFTINYANWVAPIGGQGLTANTWFTIERIGQDAPVGANAPPTNTDYLERTGINTVINSTVATSAFDPESAPMTFAHVAQWGPRNGTLVMLSNGAYTYTPRLGFVGYDEFIFSTSDGTNAPVLNRVRIVIDPALPTPPFPNPVVHPHLRVVADSTSITGTLLSFAVAAAPELRVGDVYRLTVHQQASDCQTVYMHVHCIDITVGRC